MNVGRLSGHALWRERVLNQSIDNGKEGGECGGMRGIMTEENMVMW